MIAERSLNAADNTFELCMSFVLLRCAEPLSIPSDRLSAAARQTEDGDYNNGYYLQAEPGLHLHNLSPLTNACKRRTRTRNTTDRHQHMRVCVFFRIFALPARALLHLPSRQTCGQCVHAFRFFSVSTQLIGALSLHSWPQNDACS